MKKLLYSIVFMGLGATVWADNHSPRSVIQNQLDAFSQDDFVQAFTYASPMIQSMFGDPYRFSVMVRNGYPMVWRFDEVRFLETGEDKRQQLLIKDTQGRLHQLEYEMIQGPQGWRINGVRIVPQSGA